MECQIDMTDRMSEYMTDRMPEDMPDRMPDRTSNRMPDRMPEDLPDRMSDGMNWMPWWGSLEAKQLLYNVGPPKIAKQLSWCIFCLFAIVNGVFINQFLKRLGVPTSYLPSPSWRVLAIACPEARKRWGRIAQFRRMESADEARIVSPWAKGNHEPSNFNLGLW